MGFFLLCDFGCRKGDYYRYLAEFKAGNEKKEAADQSLKAYQVSDLSYCLVPECSMVFFFFFLY